MKRIVPEMIDELTKLFVDTFNAPPWNDMWTEKSARTRLRDIIRMPNFFGGAEYRDERLVGLIMGHGEMSFDGIHFQILEFCVANDMKGQGIGTQMLGEFLDYLDRKGVTSVYLLTMRGEASEDFYAAHGFDTVRDMCIMSRHGNIQEA